jgi:hydrogenase maturation protein HypF
VNYEAQAAIELEMAIEDDGDETAYAIDLKLQHGVRLIETRRLFEQILTDLGRGLPVSTISRRFHNALIAVFTSLAESIRTESLLTRVCLSGGTFHNVYLLSGLQKRLSESGFEVFVQSQVPAGDGGLSLGQAMIAAHQLK